MMLDWGDDSSGVIYADSSAALAIAKRKGAGKLRHINVSSLWIQERQDRQEMEYRKVIGTDNPADMMTKYLLREPIDQCMGQLRQRRLSGRARSALDIQGTGTQGEVKARVASVQEGVDDLDVIDDDWRNPVDAHRPLEKRWYGETYFQMSTGEWRIYVHPPWRRALMTPESVRGLELEPGVQWTGRRRTIVRAQEK